MKLRVFSYLDYFLFFAVLILIFIGILFIYSSGFDQYGMMQSKEYTRQIFFAITGLILLIAMIVIDYRKFRQWSPFLYLGLLLVLVYTLVFGKNVKGARSWLGIGDFGVQPSEFGKIIFILYLARYLETSSKVAELKRFIKGMFIMIIPIGLILLQPDLGSASVYIPIFLVMCYMAGLPKRYIFYLLGIGCLTVVMAILPVWELKIYQQQIPFLKIFRDFRLRLLIIGFMSVITLISVAGYILFRTKYFYWLAYIFSIITISLGASALCAKVLKEYQVMRLIVFLNPEVDPRGSGWNIIQSKIAIGSGNLLGQGFLQGTQSHYRFLPEQSTDFIFSILSEEWGFVGCLFVFALFVLIFIRGLIIVRNTTNVYGYYVSIGIVFMIFFHFIINVGMVMGVMPITGIPLMFLSYGGSSLWTAMTGIGLLMGVNLRREDFYDSYRAEN
ncbi:MAG: rod shape-determining protein RodA [Spirochaetaceae bacterium]|nr:rod shape-determining protein RodA [Spirochaetaceae bacterium]